MSHKTALVYLRWGPQRIILSFMKTLNATAQRDVQCTCCRRRTIKQGERCCSFREKALSSHEAIHRGAYPRRIWCTACVDKANERAA